MLDKTTKHEIHNKNMENYQPIAKKKTRKRMVRGVRSIRVEVVPPGTVQDENMEKYVIELVRA